jgi:hypothetical protein
MGWIKPALVGAGAAAVSGGATWLYLASITLDDGLEGLVYLPILGVVMLVICGLAGWRQLPWGWARTAAIGSVVTTAIVLLGLSAYRGDALLARAAVGVSVVVAAFPFTGAVIGWGLATWVKRAQ